MLIFPELVRTRQTVLFSWRIMPDHLHLLLKDKDIVDLVRLFKGRLTPLARRLEHGQLLWQRSFYDHALREEESLEKVARTTLRNYTTEAPSAAPQVARTFRHAIPAEVPSAAPQVARYIWRNPVRSGIISCASAYRWNGSLVWPNWKDLPGADAGGDKPHPYESQ